MATGLSSQFFIIASCLWLLFEPVSIAIGQEPETRDESVGVQKIRLDSEATEQNQSRAIPPSTAVQLPPAQKIRIEPATDRVAVGKVDGLADFRDSPVAVPDAFGELDKVSEIKAPSEGVEDAGAESQQVVMGTRLPFFPAPYYSGYSSGPQFIQSAPALSYTSASPYAAYPVAAPQFIPGVSVANQTQNSMTAVFENAAHFSIDRIHDYENQAMSRRSVVIYEGMTVQGFSNGAYTVRFVAESPDVPSVVQIQLHLQEQGVNVGKITLAPVVIRDTEDSSGSRYKRRLPNQTRSWLVQRQGYSHLLKGLAGKDWHRVTVTRSGTVQMGQIAERTTNY